MAAEKMEKIKRRGKKRGSGKRKGVCLAGAVAAWMMLSGFALPDGWSDTVGLTSSADTSVQEVLDKINRYCSTSVTYEFGAKEEVLDGSTIVQWIQYDRMTGTLYVDKSKIKEYVASLAEKYDSSQNPRNFQTSLGDWITVEGGTYGWLLDQEREAYTLQHLIRYGAKRTRTPSFAQTAAGWSHSDLGDTYVEVDLTNQHVWLYVDGEMELSAPCVSGTYTEESRRTPSGTYTIFYMQSPAVLKGADYASPVTYWMAFNGGIGLHDADWRDEFGGTIYQYSGSHGCINLPVEAASVIYNYAYYGMPVICYYRY